MIPPTAAADFQASFQSNWASATIDAEMSATAIARSLKLLVFLINESAKDVNAFFIFSNNVGPVANFFVIA